MSSRRGRNALFPESDHLLFGKEKEAPVPALFPVDAALSMMYKNGYLEPSTP